MKKTFNQIQLERMTAQNRAFQKFKKLYPHVINFDILGDIMKAEIDNMETKDELEALYQ